MPQECIYVSGEAKLSKLFLTPSEKGLTLEGKNWLLFSVDLFSEGTVVHQVNWKSQKLSPLQTA